MSTRRGIAAAIGAAVCTTGGLTMVAAPAQASDTPCGWYATESPRESYYNHCGSGSVLVHLEGYLTRSDSTVCLSPGEHDIGSYYRYSYASSDGDPC